MRIIKEHDIIIRNEEKGYAIYDMEGLKEILYKEENPAYNEIIHGWRKQKYYIDFDGKDIPATQEDIKKEMIYGIKGAFAKKYEKEIPESFICICDSSRQGKISYHIILTWYIFPNSKAVDIFHEEVLRQIAPWYHKYIDYKKLMNKESSKSLRTVYSKSKKEGKEDQSIKRIITRHKIEESLITYCDEGCDIILPDLTKGKEEQITEYKSLEDIKNIEEILEKTKEQYEGFKYDKVISNMIILKREHIGQAIQCDICEKEHDMDNTLYMTVHKDKVLKHCRLAERFTKKKQSKIILRLTQQEEYFSDWPKYNNRSVDEFRGYVKKTIAFIINGGNSFYVTRNKVKNTIKNRNTSWQIMNIMLKAKMSTFSMLGNVIDKDGKKIPMGIIIKEMNGEIAYDNITFEPYLIEDKTPKEIYNMFGGFKHKYDPEHEVEMQKIEMILTHIKEIWCKKDEELYNYVIDIFAHIIQKPNEKLGIAILLKSQQGAGKSIPLEIIGENVIGENYYIMTNDIEHILGRFNSAMEGKLLTLADEVNNYGGAHRSNDKLKSMITQVDQIIERKGVDAVKIKCYNNYVFLTNNDWTIKVEASDRRYLPIEISNEKIGKKEYFDKLGSHKNDDAGYELFHYLAKRDISKFDKHKIPMTKLKKELKMNSVSYPMHFLIAITNDEIYEKEDNMKITTEELYNRFTEWSIREGMQNQNEKYPVLKIAFSREISKIIENIRWKIENKDYRGYIINKKEIKDKLEEYLKMTIED